VGQRWCWWAGREGGPVGKDWVEQGGGPLRAYWAVKRVGKKGEAGGPARLWAEEG
jgi:hypothetical protein